MAFEKITAPLLYGALFNWFFMGMLVIQTYVYILWYYHRDWKPIVALVLLVFMIETIQTALMTHTVHVELVSWWGNPQISAVFPWSIISPPVIAGLVATIVQTFLSWRIWHMGRHIIYSCLSCIIVLLSFFQFGNAIAFGVFIAKGGLTLRAMEEEVQLHAKLWLTTCLSCDLGIALIMVTIFSLQKSVNSIERTGNLLNRLMLRSVESGCVTATATLLHLVLYMHFPYNLSHLSFLYIGGKLYANVLLANLNGRDRMAQLSRGPASESAPIPLSPSRMRSNGLSSMPSSPPVSPAFPFGHVQVRVSKKTESDFSPKDERYCESLDV